MKIQLGLMGRLAVSLVTIACLSQYLNYRSFDELLETALHQRESDKIRSLSSTITPNIQHNAELIKSVSLLLQERLSAAMQQTDAERNSALAIILDKAFQQLDVDALEVTDERGIVLYRAHAPELNGDHASAWGIEEALSGKGNLVTAKTSSGPLLLYIEPLRAEKRIIGTISTGKRIDEKSIKNLSLGVGADLALVDRTGTVVAASKPGIITPDPAAISEAFLQKIPSYRTDEKTRTTVSYLPLLIVDDAWVVMSEIDSSPAFDLLKQSNDKASVFSLIAMSGAILFTLLILRYMFRPLHDLRLRAEKMVADLACQPASQEPCDDVRSLVNTLDTLTSTLIDQNRKLTAQQAELLISAAAFDVQLGMMITDADRVALRVNTAFTDITGKTADDVIGKIPSIFRASQQGMHSNRELLDAVERQGKWQGELQGQRKDGSTYPKWVTVTTVKKSDGAVSHYIITFNDISERKKAEKVIERLACYDSLTHLPNRRLMNDRLTQVIAACKQNKSFGALLFINLDNFKALNDTLGHKHGDSLLQQIAQRLVTLIKTESTVAHLGGDEFVVVLGKLGRTPQEAATQTEIVGEQILKHLNFTYHIDALDHHNSASIGATVVGEDDSGVDNILRQAGLAMYKAKHNGGNTLRFFDPKMQTLIMERAYLENALREAVTARQLTLHYQAQVNCSGDITGVEALVRWRHPERGLISPATFIPLAEETGVILPLGRWIIESACAQLAHWSSQPEMAHLTIAVNVSARQFDHPDFVPEVLRILDSTGANPRRLKLELTESMLAEKVEAIIERMLVLQKRGVAFSLDDFGTGYSSLSYLKRLPLDQLKIDQSFIRDILLDPNDAAIAQTIVALGNCLGLHVIAEGVETAAQRDCLLSIGCHAYQGYFFSRPLPVEEFEAFLHNRLISAQTQAVPAE